MINFLSDNLVTDANISIIAGTENAQFPVSNIQQNFTTKVGRVGTVSVPVTTTFSAVWDYTTTVNSTTSGEFNNFGGGSSPVNILINITDKNGNDIRDDIEPFLISGITMSFPGGTIYTLNSGVYVNSSVSGTTKALATQIYFTGSLTTTGTFNFNTIPQSDITLTFTNSSGSVEEATILIDLNRAEDFDTIALVPNNITGFGYNTPEVRFSTTTIFTGDKTEIPLDTLQGWGYLSTSQTGVRYIEMTFKGGTFVDISKIYIGKRTTLASTVGFALDGFQREIRRNDDITTNAFGQRFANVRNSQVYYTGTLPFISANDLVTVQELYDTHGRHTPIWLLFDEGNKLLPNGFDTLSGYFYFDNTFAHDVVAGGPYFNVPVQLIEAT